MSGTRNGQDWPPAGGTIDLPEAEAESLLTIGIATEVDGEPAEENAAAPGDEETATPAKPSGRRAAKSAR
ncbi:hypothetical protein OOK13_40270 [Streptomyces sp. NBC_00378]|uniref:hypothetical protein n=1 Tax=unclassified Streptomyces TaxID=2593676 RepID=UPI0022588C80|nr:MULTISPECIES: hypothetical protein [unclassified Streptomyces]MCX5112207.1 hypothetical protein [Streptomyces sp. NBC_00378]MCX5114598.1 hypothetical protein [Streptomyces sp. NBC_00378]